MSVKCAPDFPYLRRPGFVLGRVSWDIIEDVAGAFGHDSVQ